MTSKEALKRLWQETAPATYMIDFNKKECCDAIERDLNVLEILKPLIEEDILGCRIHEKTFNRNDHPYEVKTILDWINKNK